MESINNISQASLIQPSLGASSEADVKAYATSIAQINELLGAGEDHHLFGSEEDHHLFGSEEDHHAFGATIDDRHIPCGIVSGKDI